MPDTHNLVAPERVVNSDDALHGGKLPNSDTLAIAAAGFAERGIPIFPCRVGGKEPATPHGFRDRTCDLHQIERWWQAADYNIGIVPADAGWVVIDIDPKNGGNETWAALCAEHGEPVTRTVLTPSGGRHLYFKGGPIPSSNGRIGKGIDVRCEEGPYLVAPPSVRADGNLYADQGGAIIPIPEWLLALATAPRVKVRHAPSDVPLDTEIAVEAAIDTIKRWELAGGIDEPSNTYPKAARLKDLGISAERAVELMMTWWCPHFDQDWLEELVGHVWSYGQNDAGSDRPQPDDEVFATAKTLIAEGVEPKGEPEDLFGHASALLPTLNRDMLPDAPAIEWAYDAAPRGRVPAAVSVMSMLAVCAAAIDDAIKVQRKWHDTRHLERAHLNVMVVARVSAGKTHGIDAMVAPLRAIEIEERRTHALAMVAYKTEMALYKKQYDSFLASMKGTIDSGGVNLARMAETAPPEPVKPALRRFIVNDATTEAFREVLKDNPRGVLNVQDELSGFFASFDAYRSGGAGKDRAFWLQTANGGSYAADRVGSGSVFLPNLSACFIGAIQADKLHEISAGLETDGFMQRWFAIRLPDEEQIAERDAAPDLAAERAYHALLERLVTLGAITPPIRFAWDAHIYREEVERVAAALMLLPTTPAGLRGHLGKWNGQFSRLALLFHVIECASRAEAIGEEIGAPTARRVRDFMLRFLLPHARHFYREFFGSADAALTDARWIAGYILARGLPEITGREIRRAYGLEATPADGRRLSEAMLLLANAGWVGEPERDEAKKSIKWHVNAQVHERFAAHAERERTEREAVRRAIKEAGDQLRKAGID